jgi:restriction system protein
MGRNRGFTAALVQIQRQAERQTRAEAAAATRAAREAERARAAYARAQAAEAKERQRLYVEARLSDVELRNQELQADVAALQQLLTDTLSVDDFLDFDTLKEAAPLPAFVPGPLASQEPPPNPDTYRPPEPTGLRARFPGAREKYLAKWEKGRVLYEAAVAAYRDREAERVRRLAAAQAEHDKVVADIEARLAAQHAEVEQFKADFLAGEPSAVMQYFALVLEASRYPEGFPQRFRLAFVPESHQLVVEYELPPYDRIPAIASYGYVKSGDRVTEKARPAKERQQLYKSIVAQVTVRTIHELFEADRSGLVETIVFNGHVRTINLATGKSEWPCLVSVRTTRDTFLDRDFARVDPEACLLDLSANLSKSPAELVPVRPVLEFNMVDPRFVEEADVLSGMDQRSNLMELKPGEFESLITNLFNKMGLETKMTQPSRDGGVDCVAYDNRPIFGGKVIIQAKRYRNTIPVSAVRDLFGSVHNEGATKGILVTTSGFGKASFDFANDKPLELLSGSNLLYLLKEYAAVDAKIEPPEHWVDPQYDAGPAHWDEPPSGSKHAGASDASRA